MVEKTYDVMAIGRSSIDLYSNDIGVPFTKIKSFAAYVGGCPTNVSVGTRRLGLRSVLLTATGNDPVGDFILHFLQSEGVETRFIPRKQGRRSSAVIMGIEPPDKFPLVFYRENCADMELSFNDVAAAPIVSSKVLFITGTGLSREPSRSATLYAAEQARAGGATVLLDLDFRPDQWTDVRAYGVAIRSALHFTDIVIGNQEEAKASILKKESALTIVDSQVTEPRVEGDLREAIEMLLGRGPQVVVKQGAAGATVYTREGERVEAPAFAVEVCNVLGAGDAFASGLIYGYLKGWDWYRAARMGNACGALVVTRHGCANFMPYEKETLEFIEERGGF